jgi:hypothetical protein
MTVPTCPDCHEQDRHVDYFRAVVAAAGDEFTHSVAKAVIQGPVTRSIHGGHQKGRDVFRDLGDYERVHPSGVIEVRRGFKADPKRIYPVLRKITRGMYFKCFASRLPETYAVAFPLMQSLPGCPRDFLNARPGGRQLLDLLDGPHSLGDDVFVYWKGRDAEDAGRSA